MLTKKKKIIVLCTMVALLVITGYLNIMLNNNSDLPVSGDNNNQSANFFVNYRTERTVARTEAIGYYNAILADANASSSAKALAESKKDEIIALMTLEVAIEGLIMSKGFEEVIASCSDSYINIMVKSPELSEPEVAQIVEVVQSQTSKDIDYIKITPVAE